jgi:hypothetical protein
MQQIIDKYKMTKNEYNPKYHHFFMQLMNLVIKKSLPEYSYKLYIEFYKLLIMPVNLVFL